MTSSIAITVLLLAAPSGATGGPPAARPQASPSARPAHRGVGAVAYVTAAGRAYLDAGSEDGLTAGAQVTLRRGDEVQGKCTIEAIAPHHAVCTGARARAGDTFALPGVAEAPAPKLLPPPPPGDVLARRLAVVESAPQRQVVFQPTSEPERLVAPRTRAVDISLTEQAWNANPGGTSSKQSLDVLARGVPLSSWLFLDLDARVEHWSARQNPRFRPNDKTQVYVWQAQLTAIPSDRLTIAGGRVLPWGIPGATIFDGAMIGWHGPFSGFRAEAGVFGGTVPQPDTLQLTSERATGGGYWILDKQVAGGVLRTEGRVAAVKSPELGSRGEASLTGRYFVRAMDLSAEANLGAGGKEHAQGYLDSARVDATVRPVAGLAVGGSFRYAGLVWPQPFDPSAFPGHTREADGFVAWDIVRWLRLGGTVGYAEDLSSDLSRRWYGPEATFPRLLGWATVSLGYLQESGWIAGHSAYAQLVATPWKPIWLLARASWSHEDVQGPLQDEAALTLGARARLNDFLALRLTLAGRTGFDASAGDANRTTGISAFGTLQASF